MENLEKAQQHDLVAGHATDRFQRIREMIELPEENVSATFEPREADDDGLPLMLFLIIGVVVFFASVMVLLYFTVGKDVVNITLGNHFLK